MAGVGALLELQAPPNRASARPPHFSQPIVGRSNQFVIAVFIAVSPWFITNEQRGEYFDLSNVQRRFWFLVSWMKANERGGRMRNDRDSGDFERAIVAAYPRLLRFAQKLTRNPADAGDLVQDTVERGLSCCQSFQQGTAVDRWLSTILRRLFIDRCRHDLVAERADRLATHLDAAVQLQWPRPDDESAGVQVWESFTVEEVRRASEQLPPGLGRAYVMYTFEKRSYAAIANLLSIPARTVATRVSRARLRLRQMLLTRQLAPQAAQNDNGMFPDGHTPLPAVRPGRKAGHAFRTAGISRAA
jgi:RNA polymerase sigma-70 factor (ECF subfamily)